MTPKAIDLFCGAGGLTLGLRQAGFRVIGAVDNNELAVETFKANHRDVYVWQRDIRCLSVNTVKKKFGLGKGDLDLLAGCPPCQGFSTLRTLNGSRRVRTVHQDFVFEFLRFVRELLPKAVMLENVPRLATDQRMKHIIADLVGMGYRCTHDVLDAADYGVPQRRRRFILIAGHRARIAFGHSSRRKRSVRDAIGKLGKRSKHDPLHKIQENRSERVRRVIRLIPKNGGSRTDLKPGDQLACHRNCDGFHDVYGRMAWDDVAPTITGGCFNPSKGRFLHPVHHRAITLREAALLQTFSPSYFFSLKRGKCHAAQMIGNALPPEFIRRHAKNILRSLKNQLVNKG